MPDIVVRPESNIDNHLLKGMFSHFENIEKNIHFHLEFIVDQVIITHEQTDDFFYYLMTNLKCQIRIHKMVAKVASKHYPNIMNMWPK